MKVFYSIASVKGADDAVNTGDFWINGAFRPQEEETLRYSSISILERQRYAVTEENPARETAAPDASEPWGDARNASDFIGLSLEKSLLSSKCSGDAGAFLIRGGQIEKLPDGEYEGDSLPGDLYILGSPGLLKTLPADEILTTALETDRIQEIASALVNAAQAGGFRGSLTVLAVERRS